MTRPPFLITEQEVKALYDYFLNRAGYISYDFDIKIIWLIRKMSKYIENKIEDEEGTNL